MKKTFLFDMGNVWLLFDRSRSVDGLWDLRGCNCELSKVELEELLSGSAAHRAFETGGVTEREFFAFLMKELDIQASDEAEDAVRLRNSDLFVDRDSAACELIIEVQRAGFPIALLSNTDPNHWWRVQRDHGDFLSVFGPNLFVSHEIKARKPSREAYEYVINELSPGNPGEICLVDDLQVNIDGAVACQMDAVVYRSAELLREALRGRGVRI